MDQVTYILCILNSYFHRVNSNKKKPRKIVNTGEKNVGTSQGSETPHIIVM